MKIARSLRRRMYLIALIMISTLMVPQEARAGLRTFGPLDGLASSIANDITGGFWIATSGGVSRYDGLRWSTYRTSDGLANDDVRAVALGRDSSVWFGTWGGGVSLYRSGEWKTYSSSNGLAGDFVSDVLVANDGTVWVACFGAGVSRFDGSAWRTDRSLPDASLSRVLVLYQDRYNGTIWLGTAGDGVVTYFGGAFSRFDTGGAIPSGALVRAICLNGDGKWFGGETDFGGFLVRFDGSSWRQYGVADGLPNDHVLAIQEDCWLVGVSTLWVGTSGGVARFDGSSWRSYGVAEGFIVRSIYCAQPGGPYLLATDRGVGLLDCDEPKTFTTQDGLGSDFVQTIYEDRSGSMWFGTFDPQLGTAGGLSRFDSHGWRNYTTADGLPANWVNAVFQDRNANIWVGTRGGASRFDGTSWTAYTTADGLAWDNVTCIAEDRLGNLWFGCADAEGGSSGGGLSRFDGAAWQTFTTADGLAGNQVRTSLVDKQSGQLWVGTDTGLSRFDGAAWQTYTTANGLASDHILCAVEDDTDHSLWFGSDFGASRFDGATWTNYGADGGTAQIPVHSITQDRYGWLWFGTDNGVSRCFQGANWIAFTTADGLEQNAALGVSDDQHGDIWFGYRGGGVTRYSPDRAAPEAVFVSVPPRLTSSRDVNAGVVAAYDEASGVSFSFSLDGGPWSPWSRVGSWTGNVPGDGGHNLAVHARDKFGNVQHAATRTYFEVDATLPMADIDLPFSGSVVRGSVTIQGTAFDSKIFMWDLWVVRLDPYSFGVEDSTTYQVLGGDLYRSRWGDLATWDTTSSPDGTYEIVLVVTDEAGLGNRASVRVTVDNKAPAANVTTPARVSAALGGDIFTTNGELRLYFAPHSFSRDADVGIVAIADVNDIPETLPSGARRLLPGFFVAWGIGGEQATLLRPARLEMSLAGITTSAESLALYHLTEFGGQDTWVRIGGTADSRASRISMPLIEQGIYSLYADSPSPPQVGQLSDLQLTPRVFSPSGSFADREVGIAFTLGSSGPVTVRIYSRAGRLVREVASNRMLSAGANMVYWDGRDHDGGTATDGLYIVTVQAQGATKRKALAVVR